MTILSIGTPKEKKKELLIATILKQATKLADMDKATTAEALRALANLVDKRLNKDYNFCSHGCDITPDCPNRLGKFCHLKTFRCEEELLKPTKG